MKLGWKDGGGQDLVLGPARAAGPTEGREGGIRQSTVCCSSVVWQFTSFLLWSDRGRVPGPRSPASPSSM